MKAEPGQAEPGAPPALPRTAAPTLGATWVCQQQRSPATHCEGDGPLLRVLCPRGDAPRSPCRRGRLLCRRLGRLCVAHAPSLLRRRPLVRSGKPGDVEPPSPRGWSLMLSLKGLSDGDSGQRAFSLHLPGVGDLRLRNEQGAFTGA